MTGKTDLGVQAYDLLDWLNDDLEARAPQALERVEALARQAMAGSSGQALIEVQDVGAVIHRLASALADQEPEPAALSGSTIGGQLIELARFDPARHPRGPHGRFVSTGGARHAVESGGFARALAPAMASGPSPAAASLSPRTIGGAFAPAMRSPVEDLGKIVGNLQQKFGTSAPGTIAQQIVSKGDLGELESRMRDEITRGHELLRQLQEQQKEEQEHSLHERHRAELTLEILGIAAGAALTFFLGGGVLTLGVIGPFLLRTAMEKSPEIVKALAKYHIVGKGKGRAWFAHPVEKPKERAVVAARAAAPHLKAAPEHIKAAPVKVRAALMRQPRPSPS